MRLIDVCIPKFGDDAEPETTVPPLPARGPSGFQLPSSLFPQTETEYNVDDDEDDDDDDVSSSREELFFEAEDGASEASYHLTK